VERVCHAIDLRQSASVADEMSSLLDAREQAHAQGRHDVAARRYVVAHGALRLVLAEHLDVAPASLRFTRTCAVCGSREHGRPDVEGVDGFSFSLSHSGDTAIVAVAPERVGVDVEEVRARRYLEQVARRTMDDAEYERWCARREPERARAFLETWTAKEAYLKMLGVGLTRPLREVGVTGAHTWTDWPGGCVTSVVATTAGEWTCATGLP
jgi:4'-phosphopantetheinyl transferase